MVFDFKLPDDLPPDFKQRMEERLLKIQVGMQAELECMHPDATLSTSPGATSHAQEASSSNRVGAVQKGEQYVQSEDQLKFLGSEDLVESGLIHEELAAQRHFKPANEWGGQWCPLEDVERWGEVQVPLFSKLSEQELEGVDIHPDGYVAVVGWDKKCVLINMATDDIMAQVEGHGPQAPSRLLTSVTFAPRHVHPAMVSYTSTNHEAYLWDFSDLALSVTINDGFRTPLRGHTKAINDTAFHDSQLGFATASDDWTCRIWDLETMTTVRCYNNDFHFGPVTCASFYDANNPFVVATVRFFSHVKYPLVLNTKFKRESRSHVQFYSVAQ